MYPKGLSRLRGSVNVAEMELLVDALKAAKLQNCTVPMDAQDRMKCYLDSWVVGPLEHVIANIKRRHERQKGSR